MVFKVHQQLLVGLQLEFIFQVVNLSVVCCLLSVACFLFFIFIAFVAVVAQVQLLPLW